MRAIDELAAEICTLAGHLNAANHRWLTLIAEFDQRKGWSDSATQSCAHWLNWKCGMAMGAAREKVRVARALQSLPKISAAMARGSLSYSKVREITRIGSSENEDYLLMIAEHGTAQHVEKLVRSFRRCQDAEELSREARQQQSRSVRFRYDDDGSLILNCRLPAEGAAGSSTRSSGNVKGTRSLQHTSRGCPRPHCRELPRARRHGSCRRRSASNRGARRRRDAATSGRRLLRVRARAFLGRRNRTPALLRRQRDHPDRKRGW